MGFHQATDQPRRPRIVGVIRTANQRAPLRALRARPEALLHELHLILVAESPHLLPLHQFRLCLLAGDDQVSAGAAAVVPESGRVGEEPLTRPRRNLVAPRVRRQPTQRRSQLVHQLDQHEPPSEDAPEPTVRGPHERRLGVVDALVERHEVRPELHSLRPEHRHDLGRRRVGDGEVDHLEASRPRSTSVEDLLQEMRVRLVVAVAEAKGGGRSQGEDAEHVRRLLGREIRPAKSVIVDPDGEPPPIVDAPLHLAGEVLRVPLPGVVVDLHVLAGEGREGDVPVPGRTVEECTGTG